MHTKFTACTQRFPNLLLRRHAGPFQNFSRYIMSVKIQKQFVLPHRLCKSRAAHQRRNHLMAEMPELSTFLRSAVPLFQSCLFGNGNPPFPTGVSSKAANSFHAHLTPRCKEFIHTGCYADDGVRMGIFRHPLMLRCWGRFYAYLMPCP